MAPNHLSTCLRPARAPLSPRALTRARYGGAALGLPSRACSCPCSDQPMALSARACFAGGAVAKAPTQRAARRNRRRMWCLGLRLDAQGGGGGGGGGYRSYLCSTPSSCDGVECVFAFPVGARAIGRVGARRFDAAGVSNAAPTGTVAKEASAHCKAMWDGIRAEPREATMAPLLSTRRAPPSCLHAPRPTIVASPPGACA